MDGDKKVDSQPGLSPEAEEKISAYSAFFDCFLEGAASGANPATNMGVCVGAKMRENAGTLKK